MGDSSTFSCKASRFIETGSWFGPVSKPDFRNSEEIKSVNYIKVTCIKGQLKSEDTKCSTWYNFLKPARDLCEQNLEFYLSHDGLFYIRAVRDIEEGEKLLCWYEESLAREIAVPYLTPLNILGAGRYQCTACWKEFEFPNNLKLHLMHHCPYRDRQLDRLFMPTNCMSCQRHQAASRKCAIFPDADVINWRRKTPIVQRNCTSRCQNDSFFTLKACFEVIPRNFTLQIERSPFQAADNFNQPRNAQELAQKQNGRELVSGESSENREVPTYNTGFHKSSSEHGHLCVFCGKLYSRKYGLKIHIRTHTGYKPLKCRVCHRAFGDPSNLNKHIRLHAQGSTQYRCSFCDKVLVRRRDLLRHLKSRHSIEGTGTEGSEVEQELDTL